MGSSDIMKPAVWMMHSEEKAPTFDCEASATLGSKLYPAWPDCERDLRRAPTPAVPPHAWARAPGAAPPTAPLITWLKLDPKIQQACWWRPTLTVW